MSRMVMAACASLFAASTPRLTAWIGREKNGMWEVRR